MGVCDCVCVSLTYTTVRQNINIETSTLKQKTRHTLSGCRGRFLGLGTLAGKCVGDEGRIRGDLGACCRPAATFPGFVNADS